MTKRIDLDCYPDMRGMIYVDRDGLYHIHSHGTLQPASRLNDEFAQDIAACFNAYFEAPSNHVLGWFLPKGAGRAQHIWDASCSLNFEDTIFAKLSRFEASVMGQVNPGIDGPKYPLAQTMSAHEGMRKLCAYGLALGYVPVAAADQDGHPVAIDLCRCRDGSSVNPEFQRTMRSKILHSHLFDGCGARDFLKNLMEAAETQDWSSGPDGGPPAA